MLRNTLGAAILLADAAVVYTREGFWGMRLRVELAVTELRTRSFDLVYLVTDTATGAEIAALEAFAASPELTAVETATVEVYGLEEVGPDDVIYFRGVDPKVGPMTKYVTRTA